MTGGELVKELAEHVKDSNNFHFPWGHWVMPPFLTDIGITRYVLLEIGVAVVMLAIFIPMASRLRGGQPAKGRFWNMIEAILVYMRDGVITPSIGSRKDAAPYIPYLWTLFFFILFCNLTGMLPWMGAPTGAIAVTAVLAVLTLIIVVTTGIFRHGPIGFWIGMTPVVDGKVGPISLAVVLSPILFVLEMFSFFIKHFTLCIRLMANMFGGHLMLAVLVAFIPMAAGSAYAVYVFVPVTLFSLAAAFAISFLELLIACLQAYVFTFLTSIYIGIAIHQH